VKHVMRQIWDYSKVLAVSRLACVLYFLIIIGAGAFFRIYGYDWDEYRTIHPDERQIVSFQIPKIHWPKTDYQPPASQWLSTLNPKFFAYGTFPMYLLKVTSFGYQKYFGAKHPVNMYAFARILMGFIGTLTLLVVYVLGRQSGDSRSGLLASLFLCFTVLHFQHSHFYVVEILQVFLITLAVYYGLKIAQHGKGFILFGITLGLAVATKVSSLALLAPFFSGVVLYLWKQRRIFYMRIWILVVVTMVIAVVVCFIGMPFAFWDFQEFKRDLTDESRMVRLDPPRFYTFQYMGTTPYWYHIVTMFWYSIGPPLFILMILGVFYSIKKSITERSTTDIYLLSWIIPFFLVTGQFGTKFARYMLPLMPVLAVFAALFVVRYRGFFKKAVRIFTILTIIFTILYSVAYIRIYSKPHTVVESSDWIFDNVFPGAHFLVETTAEFTIPVSIRGKGNKFKFQERNLDLYRFPDNNSKADRIAENLEWADYIFSASKRVYGSVFRAPDRFPITCNFYRNLFAGHLGYELVKTFTSPPELLGLKLNEDFADESFRVYDHPKIHIFKKVAQFDKATLAKRIKSPPRSLMNIGLNEVLTLDAGEQLPPDALIDKERTTNLPRGYTFHNLNGKLAIFMWYAMIQLFGILAYPITFFIFGKLPDRGYAFSKMVGILLFAYFNWILVSLHIIPNTLVSIGISLLILLFISVVCYFTVKPRMQEFHKSGMKHVWWTESVFGGIFVIFLTYRMFHPDIFWSESSMDLSFLTSSMRSLYFPPWDTWAAGFRVNYYYYGQYIIAALSKLSGIPAKFTYNLAYITVPALVGTFLFSILYNLTRKFRYGLWAAVFGVFSCNLDGFLHVFRATSQTALKLVNNPAASLLHLHEKFLIFYGHFLQKLIQWGWITKSFFSDSDFPAREFRFFRSAHEIIPQTAAHEFPFWTFTFVDLHAHLLVMPIYILVLGLELNLLFRPGRGLNLFGTGPGKYLRIFLYAVLFTSIYPTSTWTYPVHVLIFLLIFGIQAIRGFKQRYSGDKSFYSLILKIWTTVSSTVFHTFFPLLILVITGLGLFLPHLLHFYRPALGLGMVKNVTTLFTDYLTIKAFFVFMISTWLIVSLARYFQHSRWFSGKKRIPVLFFMIVVSFCASVTAFYFAGNAFRPHRDYMVAGFLFPFLLGTLYLMTRKSISRERLYICIIALFFLLIGFGLEFACVKDDYFGGGMSRFNNIFKYYLFAWYLGAIVASYTLYEIKQKYYSTGFCEKTMRRVWIGIFLLFFLATLFFIPLGLKNRRHTHMFRPKMVPKHVSPTIDGWAWMVKFKPDINAGINWLNQNVKDSSIIVEAAGGADRRGRVDYNYQYSFISAATGLPTIIGWENHVNQRHYKLGGKRKLNLTEADKRARDVKTIYNTLDMEKLISLLNRFNVEYIFIGPLERRVYNAEGLEKFDILPKQFPIVFQEGKVTIYRYDDPPLDDESAQALENFNVRFAQIIKQREVEQARKEQLDEERRKKDIDRQKSLPAIFMEKGGFGIRKGMFKEPRGMANDKDGNLYIADFRNFRIQKFDPEGKFLTMWGEEGSETSQFNDLCDVTIDSKGNVYVADTFNSRIQKFSSNGRFLKSWKGVDRPRGIFAGPDNLIYVANTSANNIIIFDEEGQVKRQFGRHGKGMNELDQPIGITVHSDKIYVADSRNKRIQIFKLNGQYVNHIAVPGWVGNVFVEPYVAILKNGDIAATDPTSHSVYRFNPGGKLIKELSLTNRFQHPMGIVCTEQGKVYVVDSHHHKVQRVRELEK